MINLKHLIFIIFFLFSTGPLSADLSKKSILPELLKTEGPVKSATLIKKVNNKEDFIQPSNPNKGQEWIELYRHQCQFFDTACRIPRDFHIERWSKDGKKVVVSVVEC